MSGRNLALVVLWMTGALVSFSVAAVSIRALARTLGVFELLSLRSAVGIVLVAAFALARPGGLGALALHRPGLQLFRNLAHSAGQASWAYGITLLPLATVFALEFTAPVLVALLAVMFLGERLTPPRIGAVVLGLVGVLVVLRPGLAAVQPASLIVLGSALAFATTAIVTKKLTATESTLAILFWMNVMQLPVNLLGSDPLFLQRLESSQWPGALGLCLSGLSSHLCLTQAYRYGDASVVVPLDFLRIPLIALVGWQVYGEPLDLLVFLGAAIIVAGISWSLAAETRRPGLDRPGAT